MNAPVRQVRNFFVSLRLTVALLVISMVLIFIATLDQVNLGIWAVQAKYFRSFAVFWPVPGTSFSIPVFPGGYLIGGFLLVNLLSAHIYRFQLSWKKSGIQLAHSGLILLLLGELFTGLMARESFLRLDQGETKQYSESSLLNELVVIDHSNPEYDEVVSIPESRLGDKDPIQHPPLPFLVTVKGYYPNSAVLMRDRAGGAPVAPLVATAGLGPQLAVIPEPMTYKPNERNIPAAFVEISTPDGVIGTWLVSPVLGMPQTFQAAGKTWEVALRAKRYYQHFTVGLIKFSHDIYPGTDIPKNFSSRVRLRNAENNDDREVLIFMNNPLRYGGLTFYQASFEGETTTVLQVVRNPSWRIPYVACIMMALGLCIQFGQHLIKFIRQRPATGAA